MGESMSEASPSRELKISAITPRRPQQNIGNDVLHVQAAQ